jgi:hypothetical protein
MKKFLFFTLFLISSFFGFSQNGGQFFENNVIKVEYLGYFNGNHTAKVCNKQTCQARIRTKSDQDPAVDVIVPPNGCVIVLVARPSSMSVLFRAKAETSCPNFTNPDMGWIETTLVSGVLNLVEDNRIIIVRGPNKYTVELVGCVLKSDFGQLSERQTVVIHNMIGKTLEFRRIFVNKRHEVDLYPFMVKGLNLVTIFIDNKTKDILTFRVFKY